MKKVVLYGSGHDYNASLNHIRLLEETGQIEVLGISYRAAASSGRQDGYSLIAPDELADRPFDYILLMSAVYEREMTDDLVALHGIDRSRIAPFRVLNIPFITLDAYDEIRRKRWSILCNNCFGGILSHQFALEHRSPFKNLFVHGRDLVRFMEDPSRYMEKTPVFERWDTRKGPTDKSTYPVLRLDDILIHCNHHADPDLAVEDWCRRAAKLDVNRLFSVLVTRKEEAERDYLDLPVDYPKLCITSCPDHRPESVYIEAPEKYDFFAKANAIAWDSTGPINTVNLLLGGDNYLR